MPRKQVAKTELTPEQRAAAHALMQRERIGARADAAGESAAKFADGTREFVGGTVGAAAVGVKCTGVFLKRLVFGAPKPKRVTVQPKAGVTDEELRAVLKKHGMI